MTNDHIHVIYCQGKDRGLWFIPGSGMGPMQPKGLKNSKEIVEGKKLSPATDFPGHEHSNFRTNQHRQTE